MTDCSSTIVTFATLNSKAVVADFNGGTLSTDTGALLLREVACKLGLVDALDAVIPDPRCPELIEHDQSSMLMQRIIAIACGYEDLNDHQTLRTDPVFQTVAGSVPSAEKPLASPPTLCRLENRITRPTLIKMAEVLVDQFIASYDQAPTAVLLDLDATDDPLHGQQENRFFHGYYDNYCYLPLYIFSGDRLLVSYLRPSNIDGSKHSRAIVKLLVKRLREVWPNVMITLRADSGFCRWRLMRWCDSHDVRYIFGLAKNPVLLANALDWTATAVRKFEQTGEGQRVFGSFSYAAQSWDRKRRVIVKAEHTDKGANPRFIVTNLPGDPQELYEEIYCQRGEAENRIKEQQLGLFADRTSCHAFLANQFRLLLSSAAYVLVNALREHALAGTELAAAQVQTIRLKLFKVAARVVVTARRIVFHMASSYPYRDLFVGVLGKLREGRCPATEFG